MKLLLVLFAAAICFGNAETSMIAFGNDDANDPKGRVQARYAMLNP